LSAGDASVIEHIKGNLIQFLKNTPMTEQGNEQLLEVVFKMMEFKPKEIQEVKTVRKSLKSLEGEEKKKAKKGLLEMFKKKEGVSTPSPMKPIRR